MNLTRIPTFVFVGHPNEGKTTVASTLSGDDRAPISPRPGTTRVCKEYRIQSPDSDDPILILFDTPGFQNAGPILEWFRRNAKTEENPAAAFLRDPEHGVAYEHDVEIIRPLSQGAIVIHVANSARPPRQVDVLEAEILRLCGIPRIGLLNPVDGKGEHASAWKKVMREEIATWREFNPHTADAEDCINFIEGLKGLLPEWDTSIVEAAKVLRAQRRQQLEEAAKLVVRHLKAAIELRIDVPFEKGGKAAAKARAESRLKSAVSNAEDQFRKKVRQVFRQSEERWELPESLTLDIHSKETWQLFGFSKKTLVLASSAAGAGAGTLIDVATGGGTVGIGALIGGACGAAAAFYFADHFANQKVLGRKLGGESIRSRIERRSKMPGILLDRFVAYIMAVGSRPHGRRDTGESIEPARFTKELEERKEGKRSKGVDRFMALAELWHRHERGNKIEEAEEWLQIQIVEHLARETGSDAEAQMD